MAVIIAFVANLLVAIAKTVAAVFTGSASLLAEAVHSWADAGNEVFLLIADRSGARGPDRRHPLGYGRDSYVWSLFAAFGVFTIGAVLSVVTGVQELLAPEPGSNYLIGYIVLAVSFVLEASSLLQSTRQARRATTRYRRNTVDFVLNGSDATLRAVVFEDTAALVGLVLAGSGLALHQITGDPIFDALGSIAIGVLLAVVAVLLIIRNRQYLVGAVPPGRLWSEIAQRLLADPGIERLSYLHLEFVGPGRLFLVAAVDLTGDDPETRIAHRMRTIERRLEEDEAIAVAILTLAVDDEPSVDLAETP